MKILILGASGLLGSSLIKAFSKNNYIRQFPIFRDKSKKIFLNNKKNINPIICKYFNNKKLDKIFEKVMPNIVINCISTRGLKEHTLEKYLEINSFLPHQIYFFCQKYSAKFINISSDGVFSGLRGKYNEKDIPDATDNYGISKFLGETYGENSIVIRTSFIGHEQFNKTGLLEWFLKQKKCMGYNNYLYSGLTSNCLAEIIRDEILTRPKMAGIYNISANPITKYQLLVLISKIYNTNVKIKKINGKMIDRSLLNKKFVKESGYTFPTWEEMIKKMKVINGK